MIRDPRVTGHHLEECANVSYMEHQELTPFTLQQLQGDFLRYYQSLGKSQNSMKCYRLDFSCFNEFLSMEDSSSLLRSLKTQHLSDQFQHFLAQKYSNINSMRRKLQTLRLFFDFLVKEGHYPYNPIKIIKSAPKRLYPPVLHSMGEILLLGEHFWQRFGLAHTNKERIQAYRNFLLFVLIYETGLTVSQLAGLKREHLLKNPESGEWGRVLIISSKRDPYTVPAPSHFSAHLQQYLALLDEEMQRDKFHFQELFFNSNPYRFISAGISPRGIETIFKKANETLKGPDITPKSLRQSCILRWMGLETPAALIKEWMGVAPFFNMSLYEQVFLARKQEVLQLTSLPTPHLNS